MTSSCLLILILVHKYQILEFSPMHSYDLKSFMDIKVVISICVYLFLVMILITFAKLLIFKDDEHKNLTKLMGGLLVFVIAIIANNGWVFSISLFIGGLIIASEEFMVFLAAIMRSSGDKVAETVSALKATKASPKEVDNKVEEEAQIKDVRSQTEHIEKNYIESVQVLQTDEPKRKEGSNEHVNERIKKIREITELVQPSLREYFKDSYEPHMKLTNGKTQLIVDGVVRDNKGRIIKTIEIKYLYSINFPDSLKFQIMRLREKLARLGAKTKIIYVIVVESIVPNVIKSLIEENKGMADFMFFHFSNGKIIPIELETMVEVKNNKL